MTVALALFSLIAVWKARWMITYGMWAIAVLGFLLPALTYPEILRPVHKYWMKFALFLGWINSRIILSLLFYLVFTPIAIFHKIIGRDPMTRKLDKEEKTYWIDRSKDQYNPKHFERQF